MIVEEVNICEYKKLITDLFKEDKYLLSKYHISAGQGLEECVKKTVKDMFGFSNYKLYKIIDAGEPIAFFGKEKIEDMFFMTGFFIKPTHRNRKFVEGFWKNVQQTFNENHIYCSIHKKNTRAEKFLKKKGIFVLEQKEILTFKIF